MTKTAKSLQLLSSLFWDPGSPLSFLCIPPVTFLVFGPLGAVSGSQDTPAPLANRLGAPVAGSGPVADAQSPRRWRQGPSRRGRPLVQAEPRCSPTPAQEPGASRQPSSPAQPTRSPARACVPAQPANSYHRFSPSRGSQCPSRPSPTMGKPARWPRATATATAPRPSLLRWGLLGAPLPLGQGVGADAGGGRGAAQVSGTPRCASLPRPGVVPALAALWQRLGCTLGREEQGSREGFRESRRSVRGGFILWGC